MIMCNTWRWMMSITLAALMVGCGHSTASVAQVEASASARQQTEAEASPYDKPGFTTEVEKGRLWVLAEGQKKSEKHITMVGAGPRGMTIKALDRETAMAYLDAR